MKNALTVCLVGKDREATLEQCLASVASFVNQIVFVDLGSTDRTIDIARSFGADILPFLWNYNWADARNVALDRAKEEWVLFLEPYEILAKGSELLGEAIARDHFDGYFVETVETIQQENWTERQHAVSLRLFRMSKDLRYVGCMTPEIYDHNDLARFGRLYDLQLLCPAPLPEKDWAKQMYFLTQEVMNEPGRGRLHYEYGYSLFKLGRYGEALAEWQESARFVDPGAPYFPCYLRGMAQAFYEAGRFEEGLKAAEFALTLFPSYSDLHYWAALCEKGLKSYGLAAERLQKVLLMPRPTAWFSPLPGLRGFRTLAELGKLAEVFACPEEASQYYALSLRNHSQYWPAMESMVRLTEPHKQPREAADRLSRMFHLTTRSAYLSLAQILLKLHAYEVALPYLEQGLGPSPSLELRLWQALCLIQVRRFVKAQKLLEQVEQSPELYPLAKLNSLFSAWIQGQKGRCRTIAQRFREMPLSQDAESVLELIRAVALDEEVPLVSLGNEGAELLTELLIRLLCLKETERACRLMQFVDLAAGPKPLEHWAKIFYEFGAFREGQHYFEQHLNNKVTASTHFYLGEIYWQDHRFDQALWHYEQAYALEPKWPQYALTLLERYQERRQNLKEMHEADWPPGLAAKISKLQDELGEPASK